jgi:formate/nitrite transporter FocA (FNT family)
MLDTACEIGSVKARTPARKVLILSILAGIFIGMGGLFSSIAATGANGIWPYGMTKLIQGLVFSTGLILVVVGGAELFTGNSLMIIALAQKKITLSSMLKNWGWFILETSSVRSCWLWLLLSAKSIMPMMDSVCANAFCCKRKDHL